MNIYTIIKNKTVFLILIILSFSLLVFTTACVITPVYQYGGRGTLNLADTGPLTLDPAACVEAISAGYIVQIFSGLVKFDDDLNIVPDIAQSWYKSTDGLVYTFYLGQDVAFHNGRKLKAGDFKYSWERALDPQTGSLTAGTYLNDIVGASDIIDGSTKLLRGVRVINDYTLEVTISSPVPYFLNKMAYPTAFVLDKENVAQGSNWWQTPNGTGPFKLVQWQKDQRLILGRNANYYGEKAKLNLVIFQLYGGNSMQLYQEGSIDVTFVSTAYMGLVTDQNNPISQELHAFPELSLYYIGFNCAQPPFDSAVIRQAFSHAVDKERVIALATQNTETVAYGILPAGMPGFNDDLQGLPFDIEKAKSLIASSKYGSVANLPPIVFTTSGWGGHISGLLGGVIEEWRRNLGVEVTVRQLEPDVYFYYLNQEVDNIFDLGWIADYPDPQDFLEVLFRTGVYNNTGNYSNIDLDALLSEASAHHDEETRINMYRQAEQIIVDDAAVLPMFFSSNYLLVKPYVSDFNLSPIGFMALNKVSIP